MSNGRSSEVFRCERCGSAYNSMHAARTENCPRCLARDRVEAPLTFKIFKLPESARRAPAASGPAKPQDRIAVPD